MKQLILIRHGEAEHLLEGQVGGWTDTKLTEAGKQQAKCTGERLTEILKDTSFNFYTSDLNKAKATAESIGGILGKQPIVVSELREMNNGIAANLAKEDEKCCN